MMGNNLSIAAAVGGGLFVAYCLYFDHKRRSDPLFKQKLKARREAAKSKAKAKAQAVEYPDLSDFDAVQKFFLRELQTGEDLIGQGDEDSGVEHLANAIAVCGQPQSLLQVLATTLPEDVFRKILAILPAVTQRIRMFTLSQMSGGPGMPGPSDMFAAGDAEEDASIRSILSGAADSSGGIPSTAGGNFGGTIPSNAAAAGKTSAAFIDDDVE